MTATFIEHFSDLKDPRDDKTKKHELMDILFLVIAAVIGGAEGRRLKPLGKRSSTGCGNTFRLPTGYPRMSASGWS
jgi:hypothetical protein